jgi:hypothetical protein
MGLLDDAIREHLELKRLRGADPGDVARAEQAALGPVRRGDEAEPDGLHTEDVVEEAPSEKSSLAADSRASGGGHAPGAAQETVELNMEAELAISSSEGDLASRDSERAAPVVNPAHAQASSGESLEWEMPGDRPGKLPSGEGASGDADQGMEVEGVEEPVEDVLEETPDFLRDTPEQERLWFEQRPPRDFDFNE